MAHYDGVIRIVTDITTKDAKESLSSLEYQIKKSAKEINSLRSKMDALKNQKIPTKEYKDLQAKLSKAKENLSSLIAQQEEWEKLGITSGSAWDELNEKIATAGDKVDEVKAKMQALTDAGKDFTLGQDTAEYASYARQIQYEENAIAAAGEHYKKLLGSQTESYKKLGETAKKALNSIGNWLKKLNSLVDSFAKRIKSAFSKIGKCANTASKGLSGVSLSLKNILKYGFGISSLFVLINKLRTAITEGFGNLLDYSKSLENSINGIKATALTLKNAFAAAFLPFVEVALPYVQKLLDYMVQLVNIAGQFFAAITGRKTYIRAIKQATDALKEETAEMNKQLSPLDKLNNLTSQKSIGGDTGTGGTMFEEVPIEDNILNVADKIKDILSKLFEPLKKAWEQEGQFVMDSWKYALDEVWKLIKDIGRDFLTVWNEDETVAILANILHIIGDIGLVVGNLARNFREAWNTNEVGLNILRNIRDIIGIIVQHIRNAADATVEWADKLNFYPLLDAFNRFLVSIKPVVDAIWGVLEDFYTKVLLPLSKWTVEKGLPELLQVFIDFNNKVDWNSLRANLAEFWKHLEPFAETVGEGLIIFIRRVSDALAAFLNSEAFVGFLHTIEDWMDSVTPEDVADGIEKLAKAFIALKLALAGFAAIKGLAEIITTIKTVASAFSGLQGILSSVFQLFSGAFSGIGSLITGVLGGISAPVLGIVAAIGSLVAGLIYLWTTNDEAREKITDALKSVFDALKNLWDNVLVPLFEFSKSVIQPIIDLLIDILKQLWTNVIVPLADVLNTALAGAFEIVAAAIEIVTPILQGVINYFELLWTVIQPVVDILIGTLQPIFESVFGTIKTLIEDFKTVLQGVIDFIIGIFTGDWERAFNGIKEIFEGVWNGFKDTVSGVFDAITSGAEGFVSTIKEQISSLLDTFDKLKSKWNDLKSSMSNSSLFKSLGASLFKSFSISIDQPVSPVVAALSNVEIPAYATGQVIPRTMKQHLAILGDNSQETEVVSPLSTMKQALAEALAETGFGGGGDINLHLTVECEGYQLLNIMQKLDRQFYKQNGRHAFT